MDLERISLPKWPALLVVGDQVTREQAAEIIIRTGSWPLSLNDHEWEEAANAAVGVRGWRLDSAENGIDSYERNKVALRALGVLELRYLTNSQVGSCYIGGPHGWCDWNGAVFANTCNIGKWPDAATVLQDWETIAAAFPWLALQSQLLDKEASEDGPHTPLVEFAIRDGLAVAVEPEGLLIPPVNDVVQNIRQLDHPHRERGCDEATLMQAIKLCSVD